MSDKKVSIADNVARKSIAAYYNLPKNGKPVDNEWTVLSCVLQNNKSNDKLEVVSLGTGSKCIGASKMSPKGDVLNDSHAEVIARRGFLLYLYDNMKRLLDGEQTIFIIDGNRFRLKDHIEFYFYSSQLPCGDASIMPKSSDEALIGPVVSNNKRPAEDDGCEENVKKQKADNGDIHRTGAKCLPHCVQDMKDPGAKYHLLGQVRTKPGRGDPTLSVSCSDKISRWIHLGIQGALLDMILHEPIYMKMFVFGGGVPYSIESLERALLKKNVSEEVKLNCTPELQQSSVVFPHIRTESNVRPAPGSIIWANVKNMSAEVAVQGRRLGVTKKKAATCGALSINKYNLYRRFLEILSKNEEIKKSRDIEDVNCVPYNVMKSKSEKHNEKWISVKKMFFGTWTVKPDLWNFCVDLT